MIKKILCILLVTLLTSSAVLAMEKTVTTELELDDPPKDIDWTSNSNNVADWLHMDITANGHHGRVDGVDDTNGDGKVGYCDYVIVNWINLKTRQPYWKYHCKKGEYIDDPDDPDYGRWAFELDYKSKSKKLPKIQSCCHYVDDDNIGGPWDGSYEHPYRKFQDAIDAASPGDQVIGLAGTYNENIVIDKPIALTCDIPIESTGIRISAETSASSTITLYADIITISGISIKGPQDYEEGAGLEIHSNNNVIIGCDIYDCVNGIYLLDPANNNLIIENKIHACDFNFFVGSDPFDNLIYHNQLYDSNYFNAKDLSINFWDDGESRGNYWDDYEGEDVDGDGIGDEPYPIQGNINFDKYPIKNKSMYPFNTNPYIGKFEGETEGNTGEQYGYAVKFYDNEFHDGILEIDWDDGSDIEYSDYLGAEQEYIFYHTWANDGNYNIKVRAHDMLGGTGEWETLDVTMPKNKFFTLDDFYKQLIFRFPFFEKILNQILI